MNVRVAIGRLVLDGVAVRPSQRPALASAVESELARLIAIGGLPASWAGGSIPAVNGGGLALPRDSDPTVLGHRIARAVYQEDAP